MIESFKAGYRLLRPVFDPLRAFRNLGAYYRFFRNVQTYRKLVGAEPRSLWTLRPILDEWTSNTTYDAHYVYLGAWAFRKLADARPVEHVDVGSQISWITCLASIVPVVFIDIRPFDGCVPNLSSVAGSVLAMPYPDRSLGSLSCLHVAEHIGLGRYGDPLNPNGTKDAIRELARVLAPGGRLYFALPVGRPRVVFNAHRIHNPSDIIEYFKSNGLNLVEFAAVTDQRQFLPTAAPHDCANADYACGMFIFTR